VTTEVPSKLPSKKRKGAYIALKRPAIIPTLLLKKCLAIAKVMREVQTPKKNWMNRTVFIALPKTL